MDFSTTKFLSLHSYLVTSEESRIYDVLQNRVIFHWTIRYNDKFHNGVWITFQIIYLKVESIDYRTYKNIRDRLLVSRKRGE